MNTRLTHAAASLVLAVSAGSASGQTFDLFDPREPTTIVEQGWFQITNGSSTIVQTGPTAYLQSTVGNPGDQAGVFTRNPVTGAPGPAYPALDRNTGFTLQVDLRLDLERHTGDSRAGLSIIVISDDLRGIELGFWEDAIFAYNTDGGAGFTRGETVRRQVVVDNPGTSLDRTVYDLTVLGNAYTLAADQGVVLQGLLRDYSGFPGTGPGGLVNPYDKPNLIFIGDDTSQASSLFHMLDVTLTVPEPGAWVLLGALTLAAGTRRSRTV